MFSTLEYFKTSDGARLRVGYWRGANRSSSVVPMVLLLQGRASFLEKFDVVINGLCNRGYHVCSFDWRGQGLSSRQLSSHRKGHIDSYDTYLKDLHEIINGYVMQKCDGPLILLGQSMGSHLGMRYMSEYEHPFSCGILTAPLIDLNTGGYSEKIARLISKTAVKIGLGECFVAGHRSYDPIKEPFEGNMLTHDRESFLRHRLLQKNNPALSIGGVTYSWAHATFNSIEKLNNINSMSKIRVPLLIVAAGQEVVVNNYRLQEVVSWMPQAKMVTYENARHQILSESPEIMNRFWCDFESFLKANVHETSLIVANKNMKNINLYMHQRIYPSLPNDYHDQTVM